MKFELSLDGGKYTYVRDGGIQTALRYGEPWRDLCGDNLVFALASELRDYRGLCDGLDLPEDLPPGTLHRAVDTLMKWHNWIASGQLNFREDHLAESAEILKALGRPAMEMKGEPVSPEKPACPHCGGRDVEDRTTQEIATWGEGEALCKTCNREFRFELPKDKPAPVSPPWLQKLSDETFKCHPRITSVRLEEGRIFARCVFMEADGTAPTFQCSEELQAARWEALEWADKNGGFPQTFELLPFLPEPEGYFEKCRRETAEYHAAKQATVSLTPKEKELVLGLVEAGIATHDDLPPGDNIFRRKSEEMLPVYQSIKSKLETT